MKGSQQHCHADQSQTIQALRLVINLLVDRAEQGPLYLFSRLGPYKQSCGQLELRVAQALLED